VLAEIGADGNRPSWYSTRLTSVKAIGLLEKYLHQYPNAVAISAATGKGIAELVGELSTQLRPIREFVECACRMGNRRSSRGCTKWAQVTERDYAGEQARFRARIPPHFHSEFAPFIVRELRNGNT